MPNNDSQNSAAGTSAMEITVGEGMVIDESAANEAPHSQAGDVTTSGENNEPESKPEETSKDGGEQSQPDDEGKEKGEKFVSGGKKARVLGESRKKLAKTLLGQARDNDEVRNDLKELLESDPNLDKYFRKQHSKDYAMIFEGKSEEEISSEGKVSEETLRARIQAEMLQDHLKQEKSAMSDDLAEKLGLSTSEAEELRELALSIEGRVISGQELSFEDALQRAAYAVRSDKAKVLLTSLPVTASAPAESLKKVKEQEADMELAEAASSMSGRDKAEIAKNLEFVKKNMVDADTFIMPRRGEERT